MLTNPPQPGQPHQSLFESLPAAAGYGSIERTRALVRGHLSICRDEGGIGALEENMTRYETQLARDMMHAYRLFIRSSFPELASSSCRIFTHSVRAIRDGHQNTPVINFLSEMHDPNGWLTLSAYGVHRYRLGPAFSQVQSPLSGGPDFAVCPLLSCDALREELRAIDLRGSRMALGHCGSSFILAEALQHINALVGATQFEPSGIQQIRARQLNPACGAVFVDTLLHGAFRAAVELVPERYDIAIKVTRIVRSDVPSQSQRS